MCDAGRNSEPDPALLAAARDYHGRGWCVIPCRGKKPAVKSWKPFQNQRPDGAALELLFCARGVTGIAVIHGAVSGGVACRDFDDVDAYEAWAEHYADLTLTLPTAETPRGRHVYFRGPEQFIDCGDGEYRGDTRHYTLLPPSLHPSGAKYRWIIPPTSELPCVQDPGSVGLMSRVQHRGAQTTQKLSESPASQEERRTSTDDAEEPRHTQTTNTSCAFLGSSALHDVEVAIRETLPTAPGTRHKLVFKLARRLKAIPHYADAKPAVLRSIVARWHDEAMPFIGTKEFADTWFDFLRAWGKVKFPAGHSPLEVALKRAEQLPPPSEAAAFGPKVQKLAGLCRELQRSAGDDAFYLGCRTVAELFSVDPATGWRWLEMFALEGVLFKVKKGAIERRRATTWRWLGAM
jgi:hypothetical protein